VSIYTPTRFYHAMPTTSTTTLFTSTGLRAILKQIMLTNTGATASGITLYLVPSGGSAANNNMIVPDLSVPGNSIITLDVMLVMNLNDFVAGISDSGTNITVSIHGVAF
jgi:hypothetical protein